MDVQPTAPVEKVPTKRRRRIWPWIVLVLALLIPIGFIGWTGLWQVPVVSALFGTSKPIDLGVRSTQADLSTALRDNPMTLSGDPQTWYGMGKKRYSGSVPIDDVHSSAEVTSFINLGISGHRYARDMQVKFHPGGMEISAFVVPVIKAPIYADVQVARTSEKTVSVMLTKAKVGRLTVPRGYYDDIGREVSTWVNARLAEADGFSMAALEYRDNEAYLKGTLPQTVEQVSGEEYTVFGKKLSQY